MRYSSAELLHDLRTTEIYGRDFTRQDLRRTIGALEDSALGDEYREYPGIQGFLSWSLANGRVERLSKDRYRFITTQKEHTS